MPSILELLIWAAMAGALYYLLKDGATWLAKVKSFLTGGGD